jgi:hypothetical protein
MQGVGVITLDEKTRLDLPVIVEPQRRQVGSQAAVAWRETKAKPIRDVQPDITLRQVIARRVSAGLVAERTPEPILCRRIDLQMASRGRPRDEPSLRE